MAWRGLGVAILAGFLAACADDGAPVIQRQAGPDEATQAAMIEDGRTVAEGNCAQCHAIGATGPSPNPAAPVFRSVLRRYDADILETELIAGMRVTHDPMPEFQFRPDAAGSLIAYLKSIQVHDPATALVEQRCARCHAIGATDVSPYPGAQPFRSLGRRWSRDQLREALKVGILAEHDAAEVRVPPMRLKDNEIELLLDYLDSIATAENPAPG